MQITKKFVCSSIRKFDENIQFCKESKIFLWVFRNWVMLLTFTIVSSVEILVSYFDESFQLWRAAAHFGFNSRCGLPRQLWSLTSTSGFDSRSGGISDFKLQGLWLLQSSPSGFDECFGLPSALRRVPSALTWRRTHWLRACAWTRRGQATSSSSAAALPMQLCCQWILLYRCTYCLSAFECSQLEVNSFSWVYARIARDPSTAFQNFVKLDLFPRIISFLQDFCVQHSHISLWPLEGLLVLLHLNMDLCFRYQNLTKNAR